MKKDNQRKLLRRIKERLLPFTTDSPMADQQLYDLVRQAPNVSPQKKIELTDGFTFEDENDEAIFILDVLCLAMLKYRCRILFTTRSRYENHISLEVGELNPDTLMELVGKFFPEAAKKQDKIRKNIELLHRHTFAVELAARLLTNGMMNPKALLNRPEKEKTALERTIRSALPGTAETEKQPTMNTFIACLSCINSPVQNWILFAA